MSHPYLKKIVSVVGCIILSIPLTLVLERLAMFRAPGWYLAAKLFPPGPDVNIALFGYTAIGVDFLLCFAVVWILYVLFFRSAPKDLRATTERFLWLSCRCTTVRRRCNRR
jgi:hypothetical protein